MISFDLTQLYALPAEHGLSEDELLKTASKIPDFIEQIEARDQGFYKVIDEEEMMTAIEEYVMSHQGEFESVVILGIGGSALGARALGEALCAQPLPALYVIDNVDPSLVATVDACINPEKTLFLVITKSGATIETMALHAYFKEKAKHVVFISDKESGLDPQFAIPDNVGGRFSVLTPVGLLPAHLLGIDIKALLQGARDMRDRFLSTDFKENLPFQLATIQHLLYQKGKSVNVMMPYAQRLAGFTDWWRQLLAESMGKEGKGITPVRALGVTDQHSQLQLYNDGPNDKFFLFMTVKNPDFDLKTGIDDLTFNTLLQTEMDGTIQSLTENKRPNVTLMLDRLNAETLGALFMLFEAATAFLGEFWDINAFDQPGVERSKQITKDSLGL